MLRHPIVLALCAGLLFSCASNRSSEHAVTSEPAARGQQAPPPMNETVNAATSWASPKERAFELTYEVTIPEIPAGTKELKLWIPKPRSAPPTQEVLNASLSPVAGAKISEHQDASGENTYWHVVVPNPPATLMMTATLQVRRREQVNNYFRGAGVEALSAEDKSRLASALQPNQLVPTSGERIDAITNSVAPTEKNMVNQAREIYDYVLGQVEYKKAGTGWGRGDTLWVCDNRYGNCTDFHSLFMSMSRAKGIPTRFHMGIPLPPERGNGNIGGYHCWAEFYVPEMGWVPVDISEADKHPELAQYYFGALTEDRAAFTIGRDLDLTPAPASGRQNFFIYPIVEADGKPIPEKHAFRYRDL